MSKKNIFLIAFVVALAGVYAVYFTHWFRPRTIQISHTSRPAAGGNSSIRLAFNLGNYYDLTDIKVVPLDASNANPVWHLVSPDGSDSTEVFSYGEHINGMDPAIAGAEPEPLLPGVRYRLFVAAGGLKGQHDFYFGNAPTNTSNN
jgi:hypothetical protein